ncbi:YtjB family periplasmic protein [Enterovibrio makurazakiensis]|uniref:YtjB family periplasmic protein n=1 Tax=Enterovibrio gelatinilyticus TaxID=2899819 RepID=A0ABT5QZT4_9GAMM|nr:AhpA/YtjB family protein [Enterovibrio sp. ZSDZ42]MDD1792807.1 YtjB family periplasmic protein [Enterovibrio sp. ZSDZ42]
MLQINKKRLKKLWQFIILVACFATVMMLFMYSNQLNNRNYKMLYDQTESLSRVILRQAAATAHDAITNDDIDALQSIVANLQHEDLILDAAVYDMRGNLVVSSIGAMPLEQLTGLNTPLSVASIGRLQLVEPVAEDGNMVGFVRITLEHGNVIKAASNRLEQSINLVRAMILVAIVTGALLIFTFANRKDLLRSTFLLKSND